MVKVQAHEVKIVTASLSLKNEHFENKYALKKFVIPMILPLPDLELSLQNGTHSPWST